MLEIITIEQAIHIRLKKYFTGIPCKHGHVVERWTSSKGCLECSKIGHKKWKKKNPERERNRLRIRNKKRREKQ